MIMKNKIYCVLSGLIMSVMVLHLGCGTDTNGLEQDTVENIEAESIVEQISDSQASLNYIIEEREAVTINYDKESVTVTGNRIEPDEAADINLDSLNLLYTYENAGASLYYYESTNVSADGYEYNANKIVLEYDSSYKVFPVDIDADYMDYLDSEYDKEQLHEDEISGTDANFYMEYDYDNDGELELAARFVLDHGTSCLNQKLFIFDYNPDSNNYELYYLRTLDFADLIDEAVLEFYREQYDVDYNVERETDSYSDSIKDMYDCCLTKENANSVKYGDYEHIKLDADSLVEMGLEIFEIFHDYNLKEVGKVSFNIHYLGKGNFSAAAEEYMGYGGEFYVYTQ